VSILRHQHLDVFFGMGFHSLVSPRCWTIQSQSSLFGVIGRMQIRSGTRRMAGGCQGARPSRANSW
jgi:hypothetical protein